MFKINIADDFSKSPGFDGHPSSEAFRNILSFHFKRGDDIEITFGELSTLSGAFMREAFGGLIEEGCDLYFLQHHLSFNAVSKNDERWMNAIWEYIHKAEKRKKREALRTTVNRCVAKEIPFYGLTLDAALEALQKLKEEHGDGRLSINYRHELSLYKDVPETDIELDKRIKSEKLM